MTQAFAMLPNRAVADTGLSHAAFRLLALIAIHRNRDDGWSWPSLRCLGQEIGYTGASAEQNVSKLVKELRAGGYIDHESGSGRRPSHYRVIYDAPQPSAQIIARHTAEGDEKVPPFTVNGAAPPCINGPAPPSINPQTRQRNKTTEPYNDSSLDSRFEAFWKAYPARVGDNGVGKKIGKDAARREFAIALKRVTFDELMPAVAAYAANTDPRYVRDAQRWLKHKGWTDDILPGLTPPSGPQNGGNGHIRLAANAPPEAWLPLADKMGLGDDKSSHPEIGGNFIDLYAREICSIVGFDPDEPRGDWHVLAEWMREGLCDERAVAWNEYMIPELRRLCSRPGYKPPGGLAYFSKPLRENWR